MKTERTTVEERCNTSQHVCCCFFQGNNIFSELPPEEYREAINLLEHAILSTDLALYFKYGPELRLELTL